MQQVLYYFLQEVNKKKSSYFLFLSFFKQAQRLLTCIAAVLEQW